MRAPAPSGYATIDPITLAVVKGGVEQVVDEMDAIIVRAAFSPVISEQLDRASGVFHPETGEVVAQGRLTLPIFMTAMQFSVQGAMEAAERRGGFRPGDIYILNNPYLGGTHLPDVKLVMPVFHEGERVALVAACGHFNDIGGATPGGFSPGATEILQEGIIINPVPLYVEGTLQSDLLNLFVDNLRVPEERRGDLQAIVSALRVGGGRFVDLVRRYGAKTLRACFEELNDRSERHMRSRIEEMRDGTYVFEDAVDNDGHLDQPLRIHLELRKLGDRMTFDFSGSSSPARGPVNLPRKTCVASCQIAIKHVFADVPINGGCFRPFDYVIPASTFLGVEYPYPISGYLESVARVISVVFGAMSQALPDHTPADMFGTTGVITMAGVHPARGNYYVMLFPGAGGYGGTPQGDGLVHGTTALGAANFPSVEAVEHRIPVLVETLALRDGSGGAGRHRGGCGSVYVYRTLADEIAVAILGDRHVYPPFGVRGGKPGAPADVLLRNGKESRLPFITKGRRILARGDVVQYLSPGGGGWGDPLERDPDAVLRDVIRGYVDEAQACEDYGVVLKRVTTPAVTSWELDRRATGALRAAMRGSR
jgi:N-methylhydantoinase B